MNLSSCKNLHIFSDGKPVALKAAQAHAFTVLCHLWFFQNPSTKFFSRDDQMRQKMKDLVALSSPRF